jgi:hypothetical protein
MTSSQTHDSLSSLAEQNKNGQALGQAAFWRPRHAESSPVLGQVPFLFWLTEVTSSQLIVQVGLDDGVAYLALCQAVERLNNGTICFALDTEKSSLTPALQTEHDEHYSDFSQIIGVEKTTTSLPAAIDLLVIGAPLGQDGWDLLRDDILPYLSENAVLVVINPEVVLVDQTARRILTDDGRSHLTLQPVVTGGAAVDVVFRGANQPEQLRGLVGHQPCRASWLEMRQVFKRLGQGIVATRQSRDLLRDKKAAQSRLIQTEAKIKVLETEVEKAEASEKIQHHRQAEMAAQVHDLQRAVLQAEDARSALQSERDTLAGRVAELVRAKEQAEREKKAAKDGIVAQLAEMQNALKDARAEHDARIEDIVALTATYEDNREQAEEMFKAQLAELVRVKEQAEKAIRAQLTEVTAHRDALLGSTSWKSPHLCAR